MKNSKLKAATALCLSTAVLAQAPLDDTSDTADRVDLTDLSLSANYAFSTLYASAVEIDRDADEGGELDTSLVFSRYLSFGMLQDVDASKESVLDKPTAGHPNLAAAATNPLAALIQFQLQNNFIGESNSGDGYSNSFVVQPVIPFKLGKHEWISRITLPLVATADLGDPIGREYGLGDTVGFALDLFPVDKHGSSIGVGPALTLPTATSDFLGEGKFQAGPALAYVNTATPGIQWGLFGYQQWSFASSGGDSGRPEVSKLFFQPVFTWHFAKGWYVSSGDILWSIDWNDNAKWSIPLGVRLGHVTKFGRQPVNIFVEPFYDISGNNSGNEWGVKLSLTLLFPK